MAFVATPEIIQTQDKPAQEARWRWFDPILIGILWIVMLLAGVIVVTIAIGITQSGQIDPQSLLTSLPFNLAVLAIQAVTLLLAVQAGLLWRRMRWSQIGLARTSVGWVLAAAGVGLGLRVLMIPVGMLMQQLGMNSENPQLAFLLPGGTISIPGMIGMLLLTGIAIPFVEEAFFRGVVYRFFRRWGVAIAAVLSAVVFALAHLNLQIGIVAFFLGIGTALVYERSRSLWATFIVHAVFNTLGVVVLYTVLALGIQIPGAS